MKAVSASFFLKSNNFHFSVVFTNINPFPDNKDYSKFCAHQKLIKAREVQRPKAESHYIKTQKLLKSIFAQEQTECLS